MATAGVTGPVFQLENGVRMPGLGFGTFANNGSKGATHEAVVSALNAGYRHLDCAWFYKNEDEVGTGVREFLNANPSVWNHLHEAADVEWSIRDSLRKLQTPYVDAFLVHWPIVTGKNADNTAKIGVDGKYIVKKDLTDDPELTWRAMEKVYADGLAKSVGLSNWTEKGLTSLLSYAKVKQAINQIKIHPFLPQYELVNYCRSHGIAPVAYSPLGSQDQVPSSGERVLTNKELNAIAEKKNVTLAQVLIAWGLKRGYAVLPKKEFEAVNKIADGRHRGFLNMQDTFGYNVWPEETWMRRKDGYYCLDGNASPLDGYDVPAFAGH
ncbi:hypothetical protein OIDMADRAFT_44356 [Oidiodendron maius Zn]|uniref:NADP-dependent oxidoreductase domain-containing protein n=1 Tax=Oidiodendron maius (strain Zn) TaxID=913774 RepID=A0A0C3H2M6_OIDMZ|nr:hypothetical protein OIDMADRAFT_44356 [Oidiodendron maius Zn]